MSNVIFPVPERNHNQAEHRIQLARALNLNYFNLQVSRDLVEDYYQDQKFGRAPDGVQSSETTIWDRADSTPTQQILVPPTQARIHAIVSGSGNDTNSSGSGARQVTVWGLTSWTQTAYETSETVNLNGTTPVNTSNSYVFIHRMRVTLAGSSNANEGVITATAATDSTISAAINIGNGSTEMAVRAIPQGWKLFMESWTVQIAKSSGTAASISFGLYDFDYAPVVAATGSATKSERDLSSVQSTGVSSFTKQYSYPLRFTGPCYVEVRGVASTTDVDGASSFNYVVVPA